MKEEYKKLDLEIIAFRAEDIICSSPGHLSDEDDEETEI